MVDYGTDKTVREAANEFRRQHGADDWSATVDSLIESHGFDQGEYDGTGGSLGSTLRRAISGVGKKVKALVSVTKQLILIADDVPRVKVPFAKAHELGHAVLPWHRDILYVCDEQDLDLRTREQMEFEANSFAGELLLPKDLLQPFYKKFPTSMQTVLAIKEHAGASIETAIYAYVRHHPGKVGVAVLEDIETEDEAGWKRITGVRLKSKLMSQTGYKTCIGQLKNGQEFGPEHLLFQQKSIGESQPFGIFVGEKRTANNTCDAMLLNNGYKVFCLLSIGEPIA